MKHLLYALSLLLLFSCSSPKKEGAEEPVVESAPETTSFLGKPLYRKQADSLVLMKADSAIEAIRDKGDLNEEDYIAISRHLVSTGRFRDAVNNFTEGINKFPNSFKLLRHRGHRYLNLREPDKAIVDLKKAEELIRNEPETWEYDGAGNPTATYQHQIWYHIGLYHFLKREYNESAVAYEKSLKYTKEGNNIAGASDWLYNAYQRSGQTDKIPELLKPFTLDFDINEKDYPYYRRLLLFHGVITPEELVDENKPIDEMSLTGVTDLYGLADWYAYKGDAAKANELYEKVSQSNEWAGFAVACAELDLKK